MSDSYQGACFCGAVELRVTGKPNAMGYCHCESCRHWSAGPVNSFVLWPAANVKITKGAEHIGTYNKTEISYRKYCTKCGGHVMNDHPTFGMSDVFAPITPTLAFKPALHVWYSERKLDLRDGLPKFKDFPAAFGGSDETMAE